MRQWGRPVTPKQLEFEGEEPLQTFVAERLKGSGLHDEDIRKSATKLGFEKEVIPTSGRPDGLGLVLNRYRWVIRDEDLKLLETVSEGFKSAAAADFFLHAVPGGQLASATAGVLVAAVRLVRQARNKGTRIGPAEFRMLVLLKTNPEGLTPAEITAILKRSIPTTEDEVRRVLANLAKYAVGDGSTSAFVAEDGQGRWRVAGV